MADDGWRMAEPVRRAWRSARRASATAVLSAICLLPSAIAGQQPAPSPQTAADRAKANREELDKMRAERERLEQRMRELQNSAHDIGEERTNIERQANATARLVRSLDLQIGALEGEVDNATASLIFAQDELVIKRAMLRRRVREIYKRGPLYSLEALLSAQSFGALVARYKYLHLVAQRDRALVRRVELLNDQVTGTRTQLVRLRGEMELNREQKSEEERRLRELEGQRSRSLARVRQTQRQTQARLQQVQRDEKRLTDLLASFEAERRRTAAARPNVPSAPSTLRTSDLGRLDWPVEGTILYRFGRVVNPNNTTTRWNGVGIGAAAGTVVRAVAGGSVVLAESFGTYGQTVIVSHGDGDFSVYGSLARLDVRKGQTIQKGQIVGTVGRTDPDLDAHLHFEIRPKGRAVDPLEWLRGRR
ncbi:MAG: peptidoglycan DD-metalloendopeptidase family protein [Gemmatimonadetes bacterium]|nr:peptidoglycan DD-metalloendopeptidase family protein [Gemmatimonadota bacterium]